MYNVTTFYKLNIFPSFGVIYPLLASLNYWRSDWKSSDPNLDKWSSVWEDVETSSLQFQPLGWPV
jgi:hypothetical protein